MRRIGAYCLVLCLVIAGRAHAADVNVLLDQMREALLPPVRMEGGFALEIDDDAGNVTRWTGDLVRDGAARSIRMYFRSPSDLAGIVFTAEEFPEGADRETLYLPFVRRTRTIARDLRGAPFLGSDFNYEDLGLEQLDYQSSRLDGAGEVDGRPCDRVASTPRQSWWYGKIVRCIDREDHLPRRTEYFDRAGMPFKVRSLEDIQVIGSRPTPLRIRMRVVPDDSESSLTLSSVSYGSR